MVNLKTKLVLPTFPYNSSQISVTYCTLDDCIRNRSINLFTSNTRIVLLPGVHEIKHQAPANNILISNIHSLTIIGNSRDDTQIYCSSKFYFHFLSVKDITLSKITITNCSYVVKDMLYRNAPLTSVVNWPALVQYTEFSIVFSDSDNLTIEGVSIQQNGGVLIHHNISSQGDLKPNEMSIVEFLNNNIIVTSGVGFGFFIPYKVLLKSVFKFKIMNITFSTACLFVISSTPVATDLTIENIIMENPLCEARYPFSINELRDTYFRDITIIHGNLKRDIYFFAYAQSVIIAGKLLINNNKFGQTYIRGTNVAFIPGSLVRISNNDMQIHPLFSYLFHISLDNSSCHLEITNTTIIFENNNAVWGGIFQIEGGTSTISSSRVVFINNTCTSEVDDPFKGTTFMFQETKVVKIVQSSLLFENNSANYLSGGITMIKSSVIYCINCELMFFQNKGGDGGAMSFYGKSQIFFFIETCISLVFENNLASSRGGAVYVQDSDYINYQDMTLFADVKYDKYNISSNKCKNISKYFKGNQAEIAGNDLYGGWIDQKIIPDDSLAIWPTQSSDYYSISSDPIRVCICSKLSVPQCSINTTVLQSFPGETVSLNLVAVGQRYGIVPTKVLTYFSVDDKYVINQEGTFSVEKGCTRIQIQIESNKSSLILKVSPEGSSERIDRLRWSLWDALSSTPYLYLITQLKLIFHLRECPLGFTLDTRVGTCTCLEGTENPRFTCNVSTFKIIIPQQKWINATFSHLVNNSRYGVIVHDHCPYDYCKSVHGPQSIRLEHPSDQCSHFRCGTLCGKCQPGFSSILGSSACRKCSNNRLTAVVILSSGIAGVLLLVFLTVLNLTVSNGAINGIIFYANIVRANQVTYFTQTSHVYTFLRYFLAWINLDLGIETCFYDGFNAYAMTWLQFAFPIYIWSVMVIVIVSSHYSTIASKLSGNNGVPVLATLFLLSYDKILRTVITVFSSTTIDYPDGFRQRVWIYDGNIEYLKGNHIPLFIMAIFMLTVLSFPYTITLLMLQWLRKFSHYRLLFWVGKLMPLFDSYVGPYKFKHCYWTGLLLLVRVMILFVMSLNQSNNPIHNFTAIGSIMFILLAYISYIGGVYKNHIKNILEIIMMLNLGLLSIGMVHRLQAGGNSSVIICTSAGLTFIIFIFIVICHAWKKIMAMQIGQHMKSWIIRKYHSKRNDQLNLIINDHTEITKITHTSVDLQETLLK